MDKKTLGFTLYFVLLTLLATLPQVFDWSNRISPWILGMPFSIFWQLLIAVSFSVGLIVWYVADDRSGDLDVGTDTPAGQVDARPNSEPTTTRNRTEAKEGESQ
jgi:hypothetical protein